MPTLTVVAGPDAGKQFPLSGPAVSVGRHSGNAVPLHDDRVSRRHLELRATPAGGYAVYDLNSGNGTVLNGRTVQVAELRPGDRIAVGNTVLRYDSGEQTEALRLVVRPGGDVPSAVLRSVAADDGSRLLRHPELAATDWLRTRLANLAVLYEAASAVSEVLDVDELLGRVVELVLRTTDADHGCVMLTDPDTGELMPKAVRGRADLPGSAAEFVVSRTVVDHVLKAARGVLVADAAADERFRAGESVARHRLREVLAAPMKGRHETVGVLFLSSAGGSGSDSGKTPAAVPGLHKFSEDHLRLAVAVAHQAALAVEETRYYQALLQAERLAAVGQTIAALSHHIKNIMQGVRFGSDMVRTALADNDRDLLTKGWRLVEKNQGKIDDLMLDMLNYSKEREPLIEPTDLNALAADVLDVVRGRATDAGVSLDWTPGELPPVPCDPDGIHRALLNVVSNAVDATEGRDPARVAVATRLSADGFAEVIVSDTGGGIPPDKLADIFRPFVSTKGAKGTGLGLPVSRKVLREHGGDVLVESDPGHGSRFVLRLPLTRQTVTEIPDGRTCNDR